MVAWGRPGAPPEDAGSADPQVTQKRYPSGLAVPQAPQVGPAALGGSSGGPAAASAVPRAGAGGADGLNEKTGASGRERLALGGGGGVIGGGGVGALRTLARASGVCGSARLAEGAGLGPPWASRSTSGRPFGGVGGAIRFELGFSRLPQSLQNVRLSGFSRPQTSQSTRREDRGGAAPSIPERPRGRSSRFLPISSQFLPISDRSSRSSSRPRNWATAVGLTWPAVSVQPASSTGL